MLDSSAAHRVASAERSVVVDEKLGHNEQRDALHTVRRAGRLGKDEVDDVFGQVVLA